MFLCSLKTPDKEKKCLIEGALIKKAKGGHKNNNAKNGVLR